MNKGQLMKLVYSEEELRSVDSALPVAIWDRIDTAVHVMDYNEPHRFGKVINLVTEACNRGVNIKEHGWNDGN